MIESVGDGTAVRFKDEELLEVVSIDDAATGFCVTVGVGTETIDSWPAVTVPGLEVVAAAVTEARAWIAAWANRWTAPASDRVATAVMEAEPNAVRPAVAARLADAAMAAVGSWLTVPVPDRLAVAEIAACAA